MERQLPTNMLAVMNKKPPPKMPVHHWRLIQYRDEKTLEKTALPHSDNVVMTKQLSAQGGWRRILQSGQNLEILGHKKVRKEKNG